MYVVVTRVRTHAQKCCCIHSLVLTLLVLLCWPSHAAAGKSVHGAPVRAELERAVAGGPSNFPREPSLFCWVCPR